MKKKIVAVLVLGLLIAAASASAFKVARAGR